MLLLASVLGVIVGLSLGLTGGGGALLALPFLSYGVGLPPQEAVAVALTATGVIAAAGAVHRWRSGGEIELRAGVVFALSGMLFAPLGAALGLRISPALLLGAFTGLMMLVAVLMWRAAARSGGAVPGKEPKKNVPCQSASTGSLKLNSRCAAALLAAGVITGILAGLFGVGGGFLIVPALLLVSGMNLRRAVATSLLVIALISVAGVAAFVWQGRFAEPLLAAAFTGGGLAGLWAATLAASRLPQPVMQRVFAALLFGLALLMLGDSVFRT